MTRASPSSANFGCNTYSYMRSQTAERCLVNLSELGFREFELMVHPGHLWPAELSGEQRAGLRRLMEERDLQLVSLNMPNIDINVAGAAAEMRAYSLNLLTEIVRLAGELGAAGVVIGPGKANPLFPAEAHRAGRPLLCRARPAMSGRRGRRHGAVGREHAVCLPARHRPADGGDRTLRQRRGAHRLRYSQRVLHRRGFCRRPLSVAATGLRWCTCPIPAGKPIATIR